MTRTCAQWLLGTGLTAWAAACSGAAPANLLRNPEFSFQPRLASGRPGGATSHNVACWNTDAWGDITVSAAGAVTAFAPVPETVNVVRLAPGKRFYQFTSLPELGVEPGTEVSLRVHGFVGNGGGLRAGMTLMRIESGEGTWCPKDFGCRDARTFNCHGRGELIRGATLDRTADTPGPVTLDLPGFKLETVFEKARTASPAYTNPVGLLVEFRNAHDRGDVWVYAPVLAVGAAAPAAYVPGRPGPEYYRRMPLTIGKLMRGEPIHVLCLGSSIDTGSANPPLYFYDENPESPTFKQPLWEGGFDAAQAGRPDLKDYVHYPAQFFKYTGRLRRELLRKFNLQVSDVFLNAMSRDGSSIGESHSGFADYTALEWPPSSANGHPAGRTWTELYPALFRDGAKPAPDLVIFGHGHNERIDRPDGIAVYEGAIRWFQQRFPGVEFLFCQWHTSPTAANNIPPLPVRRDLCAHYGIPFIDISPVIEALSRNWCNFYALCPDGGHAQAAAHYLWFRQIEQAFEMAAPLKPFVPQRRLPDRFNAYTYGWEGDVVTFTAPHPRINGARMIIEDTAFNLWCDDGHKEPMTITIDGSPVKSGAGHGRATKARNVRNSSFVHGRLSLGDRHILEISGQGPVTVHAADFKVCGRRNFFGADHARWVRPTGMAAVSEFASAWGAPCGERVLLLAPGQSVDIEVDATDLSVAYVDAENGGTLNVEVDGGQVLTQPTDVPFTDTDGVRHFIENRKGIRGLTWGRHRVTLTAAGGAVRLLGLYTYDARA